VRIDVPEPQALASPPFSTLPYSAGQRREKAPVPKWLTGRRQKIARKVDVLTGK